MLYTVVIVHQDAKNSNISVVMIFRLNVMICNLRYLRIMLRNKINILLINFINGTVHSNA